MTMSPIGISHSEPFELMLVYNRSPEYLLGSGAPKLISPSVVPSLFLCRDIPNKFCGRALVAATVSMTVGESMYPDVGRPRPRIPSIGYVENSSEVVEAKPKESGSDNPAICTVSLKTVPETVPEP